MASKQRRARASGQPESSSAHSAAQTSGGSVHDVGSSNQSGWFGDMVGKDEPVHGAMENGVSRPDKQIRGGQRGAAISEDGEKIDVYDAYESEEPSRTMKSGLAVKVVSTKDEWMEVEYREKDSAVRGWIHKSVYSDQPGLGMDEDLDSKVFDNYTWTKFDGDQSTEDLEGNQVEQGALGNCFFIASMNAVGSANADFLEESIVYDEDKEVYKVRFFEYGEEVWVEVDAYLPTTSDGSHAYAGSANGGSKWGPILEKAYAKFKGGYHVLGEGGTGRVAMQDLTGNRSKSENPAYMDEEEVIPFFQKAKEDNLAIYAGVKDTKIMETVTPFSGSGAGPFKTKLPTDHDWDELQPGHLEITHEDGEVSRAYDRGKEGDKEGEFSGSDVDESHIDYKKNRIEIAYDTDVEDAKKLQVAYGTHGVYNAQKMLIGNHAYSFTNIVDGNKLQFYNPWGSYQPKPITAAEFLDAFDSVATNQVPKAKKSE